MAEPSTPTDSSQTHLAMMILLQKIHRQSKRKARALISEEEEEKREKMATKIRMMDGAYIVGKSKILALINLTLHLNLSKVENVSFFLLLLSLPVEGFISSGNGADAQSQLQCQK
ncbi:hypothetical protein V6N13_130039 [Hibiscus sabdariffa]|uniref:Uncharacterized protein n=1 Tax=Hibiscus sabdariffa TaxID=183260 RepID=A0ABR2SNN4_9ROSI